MKTVSSNLIMQGIAIADAIARRTGVTLDSVDDALTLRRAALTLHRWYEGECGGGNAYASWAIERDDTTGAPYRVTYPHNGKAYRTRIPDREQGALRRIAAVCARYGLAYYVQTDPRGATLYVARPEDGMTDRNYSSVGVCVVA